MKLSKRFGTLVSKILIFTRAVHSHSAHKHLTLPMELWFHAFTPLGQSVEVPAQITGLI